MARSEDHSAGPADAPWDRYWQGTRETAAHGKGLLEPVLAAHWRSVFQEFLTGRDALVVDVACGNGVLASRARAVAPELEMVCCDLSLAALSKLRAREHTALPVLADAARIPLAPGSVDLLISQFGVEYAGPQAVVQVAECVAPGGCMALVMHCREGAIHAECAENLSDVDALQDSGLLPALAAALRAGFALDPADADSIAGFRAAERALAPALKRVEALLQTRGDEALGGLARRFYDDIARIYPRMGHYDMTELIDWLQGLDEELVAYRERMAAMLGAGLAPETVQGIVERLSRSGWTLHRQEGLRVGAEDAPFAHAITLTRA
jgi:SAM-dependent methyltransferase